MSRRCEGFSGGVVVGKKCVVSLKVVLKLLNGLFDCKGFLLNFDIAQVSFLRIQDWMLYAFKSRGQHCF